MQAGERSGPDDARTGRPSRIYARVLVFLRFLILPAWVAAAVAVYLYGPTIGELPTANVNALLPSGLPAEHAEEAAARIFGSSLLPRIAVVQRDPGGLGLARQAAIVRQAVQLDRGRRHGYPDGSVAVPYVNTLSIFPAARERGTTAITYLAFPGSVDVRKAACPRGAVRASGQRARRVRLGDRLHRRQPAAVAGDRGPPALGPSSRRSVWSP